MRILSQSWIRGPALYPFMDTIGVMGVLWTYACDHVRQSDKCLRAKFIHFLYNIVTLKKRNVSVQLHIDQLCFYLVFFVVCIIKCFLTAVIDSY